MKHYQESEIEFRLKIGVDDSDFPTVRGIIIHQYGGTLEECIEKARKQFGLDNDKWELIRSSMP